MDHQLMSSRPALVDEASPAGFPSADRADRGPGLLPLLVIASWCGLVSGLLEVATLIVRKQAFDFNQLYWMSRHFVWLIPLINLVPLPVSGPGALGREPDLATTASLDRDAVSGRVHAAGAHLGRLEPAVRAGRLLAGSGVLDPFGSRHRATCRRFRSAGSGEPSAGRRSRAGPGGVTLGRRPANGLARAGAADCRRHRLPTSS